MKVIEVNNLTKKYGEFMAVKNLSFSIEEGTIVGFVGKNGAGKSTTIRCLTNMILPTNGSCKILEMDCVTHAKEIKEKVSYMSSDAMFYANVTSKDIFSLCAKFDGDMQEAEKLSAYFELDTNKKIGELSLGNRKKTSIIQALMSQKKLLILDEPTSGLDPLMQEKFFNLLLKLKNNGITIFLSSHNLMEIERYCDRAIIIKDGELIDDIDMIEANNKRIQVVHYIDKEGKDVTFEFDGEMNELIKQLGTLNLMDLEIRNKTIEEEFIKYYKEEV